MATKKDSDYTDPEIWTKLGLPEDFVNAELDPEAGKVEETEEELPCILQIKCLVTVSSILKCIPTEYVHVEDEEEVLPLEEEPCTLQSTKCVDWESCIPEEFKIEPPVEDVLEDEVPCELPEEACKQGPTSEELFACMPETYEDSGTLPLCEEGAGLPDTYKKLRVIVIGGRVSTDNGASNGCGADIDLITFTDSVVDLIVHPSDDWEFEGWLVDGDLGTIVNSKDNWNSYHVDVRYDSILPVTMDESHEIIAIYSPSASVYIPGKVQISVTIAGEGNLVLSPEPEAIDEETGLYIYAKGTEVTVNTSTSPCNSERIIFIESGPDSNTLELNVGNPNSIKFESSGNLIAKFSTPDCECPPLPDPCNGIEPCSVVRWWCHDEEDLDIPDVEGVDFDSSRVNRFTLDYERHPPYWDIRKHSKGVIDTIKGSILYPDPFKWIITSDDSPCGNVTIINEKGEERKICGIEKVETEWVPKYDIEKSLVGVKPPVGNAPYIPPTVSLPPVSQTVPSPNRKAQSRTVAGYQYVQSGGAQLLSNRVKITPAVTTVLVGGNTNQIGSAGNDPTGQGQVGGSLQVWADEDVVTITSPPLVVHCDENQSSYVPSVPNTTWTRVSSPVHLITSKLDVEIDPRHATLFTGLTYNGKLLEIEDSFYLEFTQSDVFHSIDNKVGNVTLKADEASFTTSAPLTATGIMEGFYEGDLHKRFISELSIEEDTKSRLDFYYAALPDSRHVLCRTRILNLGTEPMLDVRFSRAFLIPDINPERGILESTHEDDALWAVSADRENFIGIYTPTQFGHRSVIIDRRLHFEIPVVPANSYAELIYLLLVGDVTVEEEEIEEEVLAEVDPEISEVKPGSITLRLPNCAPIPSITFDLPLAVCEYPGQGLKDPDLDPKGSLPYEINYDDVYKAFRETDFNLCAPLGTLYIYVTFACADDDKDDDGEVEDGGGDGGGEVEVEEGGGSDLVVFTIDIDNDGKAITERGGPEQSVDFDYNHILCVPESFMDLVAWKTIEPGQHVIVLNVEGTDSNDGFVTDSDECHVTCLDGRGTDECTSESNVT